MKTFLAKALLMSSLLSFNAIAADTVKKQISETLDKFHQAASEADGTTYFSLLTPHATFIGTDAIETWTVDEFKAFAEPYFGEGRGWTYTKTFRRIDIAEHGKTAWFVEMLYNKTYGETRGTGVLELTPTGWRISQYHLTIPIPNDLAKEMTSQIKAHLSEKSETP